VIFIGYSTFVFYAQRVSRIDKRVSMPEYILVTKMNMDYTFRVFHFGEPVKQGAKTRFIEIFADLLRSQVSVLSP